jgi:hypothetical protein
VTELLTLSTIVKRETIFLASKKHPNGKTYEIAGAADFGPVQYAILQVRADEVSPLLTKAKLTKKQESRVAQILDEMVKMIVRDLEPTVLRELTTEQKQMIVLAWTATINAGRAEGNAPKKSRSTGSK